MDAVGFIGLSTFAVEPSARVLRALQRLRAVNIAPLAARAVFALREDGLGQCHDG